MKRLCDGLCPCRASGRPSGLLSAIVPKAQSGKPPIPTPGQLPGKQGGNHSGQVTGHSTANKHPVQPSSDPATGQSSGVTTTPAVKSQTVTTTPKDNIDGKANTNDNIGIIYRVFYLIIYY